MVFDTYNILLYGFIYDYVIIVIIFLLITSNYRSYNILFLWFHQSPLDPPDRSLLGNVASRPEGPGAKFHGFSMGKNIGKTDGKIWEIPELNHCHV